MDNKQLINDLKRLELHYDFSELVKPKVLRGKKLYDNKYHNKTNYEDLTRDMNNKFHQIEQTLKSYEEVWAIDYTALSTTKLALKKNRYLLNRNGLYFIKGYCVALNLVTRKIILVETNSKQLAKRDVVRLKKYLPKNTIMVSDKRHKGLTFIVSKKTSQLIEDYFGIIKREIYRQIREYQTFIKGYYVTNISFSQLEVMYEQQFKSLNITVAEKVKPKQEKKNLK